VIRILSSLEIEAIRNNSYPFQSISLSTRIFLISLFGFTLLTVKRIDRRILEKRIQKEIKTASLMPFFLDWQKA